MKASNVRQMDETMNSLGLGLMLVIVMGIITHFAIQAGGSDPFTSIAIALANGMVGALYIQNHKVWGAQLSGYNHHQRWNKEQMKLAAFAAVLIIGCLTAAFFGIKYGMGIDKAFGAFGLLMSLPVARAARNAIKSNGAVHNKPTSAA
jgi:hypothetical protein